MNLLTIGQLAKRFGVRTSTLRYYEKQGLLTPAGRTEVGYRLYDEDAEEILRFIQRAQRAGFSLADIRALMQGMSAEAVTQLAEDRYLALERSLTRLLVLRHELEHLMVSLQEATASDELFDRLLQRVCGEPLGTGPSDSILAWLAERTDCRLASADSQGLLRPLRGRHIHVWQSDDQYHILVVGHEPVVEAALQRLVHLETDCQLHPAPRISPHPEGFLLSTQGENGFFYARLFLVLENEHPSE